MAIKLTNTSKEKNKRFAKIVVYGSAFIGKTRLATTAEKPIIISCDKGLMSLQDDNIPSLEVTSLEEFEEAMEYVISGEGKGKYKTLIIDSISELSDRILEEEIPNHRNGMQAYGVLYRKMRALILNIRDHIEMDVIMLAKIKQFEDGDVGFELSYPDLEGKKTPKALTHWVDEIWAMRKYDFGDKGIHTIIQTESDDEYFAKGRGQKLKPQEKPDLTYLLNKVKGISTEPTKSDEK